MRGNELEDHAQNFFLSILTTPSRRSTIDQHMMDARRKSGKYGRSGKVKKKYHITHPLSSDSIKFDRTPAPRDVSVELKDAMHSILSHLELSDRMVFVLYYYYDLSLKEIAFTQLVSESMISLKLKAIRQKLQKLREKEEKCD